MATIVCAVDDSPGSLEALRVAAELSEALGLRLVLAHVARRLQRPPGIGGTGDTQARDRAERLLARVCHEHGLDRRAERRVEVGDCATELVRIATEEAASVLVVGARTPRMLRRRPSGELATELDSALTCPIVVVAPRSASASTTRLRVSRANR